MEIDTRLLVCVAEDDAAVRNALKFALEVEGLEVRAHEGAVALLADPELGRCRCLVLDYRMPVMDGLELAGVLRQRGVEAPVILITGRSTKDLRRRVERLGLHDLIEKPLSDGALLESIRSALATGAGATP